MKWNCLPDLGRWGGGHSSLVKKSSTLSSNQDCVFDPVWATIRDNNGPESAASICQNSRDRLTLCISRTLVASQPILDAVLSNHAAALGVFPWGAVLGPQVGQVPIFIVGLYPGIDLCFHDMDVRWLVYPSSLFLLFKEEWLHFGAITTHNAEHHGRSCRVV